MTRPRVGISACLLGERVRYDGDHRLEGWLIEEWGPRFEWVPICPEMAAGFGVPRETLQLEGDADAPRLLTTTTRQDRTEVMTTWIEGAVDALVSLRLAGFILKQGSPSCGPQGVKLFREAGDPPAEIATGLFARALRDRMPDLPIADETMLRDPLYAAAFLERLMMGEGAGRMEREGRLES